MITGLDHLVVAVRDLEAGVRAYETLFGRAVRSRAPVQGGGAHVATFDLGNTRLELIAPSGEGPMTERLNTVLAAHGEGLASLAFAVDDIEAAHRRLDRVGLDPEPIADAEGSDPETGAKSRWRRTRAGTAATHGVRIFFIQRDSSNVSPPAAGSGSVAGLDHVVIRTPNPERAAALYGARLRLDLRLDRSNQQWDSRLMFFRCGDLIVELAHDLAAGVSDDPDRLWGLSWRVRDVESARARLSAAGLDVSELRSGRKPGTRVFSVRDQTCGVPTLVLQPSPGAGGGRGVEAHD
jgi:catechol 2,3-dioxygenase-like lactoylglutathione lyase family enzyme